MGKAHLKPPFNQIKKEAVVAIGEAEQAVDENDLYEANRESPFQTLKRQDVEIADLIQDRKERKLFARVITVFVSLWLILVLLVVVIDGLGGICQYTFSLSTGVVLALLGTVTVNVIGLFYVVARYLFHRPKLISFH